MVPTVVPTPAPTAPACTQSLTLGKFKASSLCFDVTPIPGFDGSNSSFAGGDEIAIPSGSKNKPAAQEFVWARAKENYFDKGVRVFWLDEAEPELVTHSGQYDWDVIRYQAGPALKVGNLYPVGYARGFYEGQRAAGQTGIPIVEK